MIVCILARECREMLSDCLRVYTDRSVGRRLMIVYVLTKECRETPNDCLQTDTGV
jgi:hypothetical protein